MIVFLDCTNQTASPWLAAANSIHLSCLAIRQQETTYIHSIVYTLPFVLEAPQDPKNKINSINVL